MSLNLKKTVMAGGTVVWKKILEVFDGGFTLETDGFVDGTVLPEGSLLKINEATRKATPVKTGVTGKTGTAKNLYVVQGHHFQVGDYIVADGATAVAIKSISPTGELDHIVTATGIGATATGAIVLNSATGGTGVAFKTAPNAISLFDTKIEAGASVAAVRRGTAYSRRIQAHTAGLVSTIPATIQLSDSF